MKVIARVLLAAALLALPVNLFGGTVAGTIATAGGGAIANGTVSFALSQLAVSPGNFLAAPQTVNCWTARNGGVVGLPGDAAVAAPVLSSNLGAGTLPNATYFLRYTWSNTSGESEPSSERALALGGVGTLILGAPASVPPAATLLKVYIGTTSGGETLQGSVVVTGGVLAGNYSQSAGLTTGQSIPNSLTSGAALPSSNTSACSLAFNDSLLPTYTGYQMNVVNVNGAKIPGFPVKVYLSGGPSGTINVSQGIPVFSGTVVYPSPIVAIPAANSAQSINGPLSLNGFGLTAGSLCLNGDSGITRAAAAIFNIGTCAPGDSSGTLRLSVVQQTSGSNAFAIEDPNGCPHLFISNTPPFTNTFLGCGAGNTFIGAHFNVAEPGGSVSTDGSLFLFSPTHTLLASIGNDASGGISLTTAGSKNITWLNSGILIVNPSSVASGAALTVGGTSATTGGMSIFVGASGSQTESAAIYPADGASAPLRVAVLQGRTVSAGLLTGAINWQITNAGVATTLTLGGAGSTAPNTLFNRFRANQGTSLVCGDFAVGAGWGNTASCSVRGTDSDFTISITSNGAGIAANPTLNLTFHDGTWTTAPICQITRGDGSPGGTIGWINNVATTSATLLGAQFVGTPSAGSIYTIWVSCHGTV